MNGIGGTSPGDGTLVAVHTAVVADLQVERAVAEQGAALDALAAADAERFVNRPDKGGYSHIMNAMEYAAAQLFAPALTRGVSSLGDDWPSAGYGVDDRGRSEVTGY